MISSNGTPSSLRIAMVGTRGIPARYGGFETCVEEVGKRLVQRGHSVVVYCRNRNQDGPALKAHQGMQLVHLPAPKVRSMETLLHTGLSVSHLMGQNVDAAIVFNAANGPWLPALRAARIPVATHVDGLEWQRDKWGPTGKRYYRWAEGVAVRFSDALIADAQGIQDYYQKQYGARSELMAYGAPILGSIGSEKIAALGLRPGRFHLVVARFEPENHVETIVRGYVASKSQLPLVVVGSAPYSAKYSKSVADAADSRVRFLGGVWDQDLLNELYAHSLVYWHGHSVGGTNPSLLRAMGAGAATNAYDVNFNREVLGSAGSYFSTEADIPALVEHAEHDGGQLAVRRARSLERARDYSWDDVANRYERLCFQLATKALHRTVTQMVMP